MIHRHLQVRRGTPPAEWPLGAIVDLLDRGDLDDWKPLAAAIRRDPSGALAEQVLRLLDAHPMYGTSALWRSWIHRCRARAEGIQGDATSRLRGLAELRRDLDLTQAEVAARVGISQSDLSKLERRSNVRLSTLRSYFAALGGDLEIVFDSPHGRVEVEWPQGW